MKKTILSVSVVAAISVSSLAMASKASEDKFNNFEAKAKTSTQNLAQDEDIKNQVNGMAVPSIQTFDLKVPRNAYENDFTMSKWKAETKVRTGQLGYISVGFDVEFNIENEAMNWTMGGLIGRDTSASTMIRNPTSVGFYLVDAETNEIVLKKKVELEHSIIPNRDRGLRKQSVIESAVSVNLLAGDSMTGLKKHHEYIVKPVIFLNSLVLNDEFNTETPSGTFVNQAKLTVVEG
ncbi:hypothetical protein [Photobacterium leiognathi]|uniref:hypothetical protein n=1 Tax=Photobacterium leiognathi TaxID=553611 RepID=UPI00298198C8|nr:hypothetical protein [Photobacterium leiognathi]